jgi:putative ABC transport system permease protein
MVFKIAFRNSIKAWRRTLAVVGAVAVSVFLLEVGAGYMDGFRQKIYTEAVRENGHLRLVAKGYADKLDLLPLTPNMQVSDSLLEFLGSFPEVEAVRPAIRFGLLANSASDVSLEMLGLGVSPRVSRRMYERLANAVVEGDFLNGPNQVVIGTEAARLLKVSVGERLILLSSDVNSGFSAVEPQIAGIFKSLNAEEDAQFLLCDLETAQKLLNLPNRVTEITIELAHREQTENYLEKLRPHLPTYIEPRTWRQDQASIIYLLKLSDVAMAVLAAIVLVVAALGMINTFLMSVLERLPEFGTLRAIGMGRGQLVSIVVLQGLFSGVIGTVIGLIAGIPVVLYYQAHPIDYGEAMESFKGVDSMIGMAFEPASALGVMVLGLVIAIGASLYPALYASRKRPVEILRSLA